ncbi:MAG: hypothetical protein IT583_01005 [Verrucomicrobia bacterium]|nr:hypothetical protein [Verrucomicrobiota bacterium]
MGSGEKIEQRVGARRKSVAVETLGIVLGSAVLGSAVTVFVLRAMQGGVEVLSTIDLLGFLLMFGLSISAIVLAVTAISLSRSAERNMAQKAEEISDIRVAMTEQTLTAVERMEASVLRLSKELADAVCENSKRLAVSRPEVVESVEQNKDIPEPPKELVRVEKKVPLKEPSPKEALVQIPAAEPVTDEAREKADKRYGEFKDIVLLGVANYPGVIVRKMGEGQYRTEGDDLADGVFVIQNEKVAVCTFCVNDAIIDRFAGETGDGFNGFLKSLVNELRRKHFTRILLVFDAQLTSTCLYAKALNGLSGRIDTEIFSRFELFEGSPAVVIPELTERVSQLMEESSENRDAVPELSFRNQVSA